MAIVKIDPADWQHANVLQIDSDAPNNLEAVKEIESWSYQNGFARTPEYWLRRARRNGQMLFRGICFRVAEDELEVLVERQQQVEARAIRMEAALRGVEGS